MKKLVFFKTLAKLLAGPAAGAFGLWLLAEAPLIHSAMCQVGV